MTPSNRRKYRSAPPVIQKSSRGIPAERQAVHFGVLVQHYPAVSLKSGGGGVSMRISPRIKKEAGKIERGKPED